MQLSDKQLQVFERVVDDIRSKKRPEVIYAGSAGTGKTTLLASLAEEFDDFLPVTWTGKAARRMQEVGIPTAQTIHSTIYRPVFYGRRIVGFTLRNREDLDGRGFLVDEASTLSKTLYKDIRSFGLPCVFVGDHKQLEPIGDDAALMTRPDYVLEEIHRNAGDIARFAEKLSRGESVSGYKSDQVTLIDQRELNDITLSEMDQVICAFNTTRVSVNRRVKQILTKTEDLMVGDRVICLKNNKKLGLFNGMQGEIVQIHRHHRFDLLVDDFVHEAVPYNPRQFYQESAPPRDISLDGPMPFDMAYCCTAHKFQGSEAEKVLVYAQHCNNWSMDRWNYTAASRAKTHLIWAM